ncbi:hypothetical protein NDU88_000474 [Pleurodeles waltl]|uniref:Uncharacterized protein n=1 Tax=Pleurodeles waltl TaxID=8319 RepID=A0AAV7UQL5_PLEWA|nr:hypothetical protein NDU88_000474 [Pleurodeles waltl]
MGCAQAGATSKSLGFGRPNLLGRKEKRTSFERREEQSALGRGLRGSVSKEAEDARENGRNTAERLRGKRELNAYLRSAAGEPNVRKNVRLGPRGASAPIKFPQNRKILKPRNIRGHTK